ncbi:hypothetical protein D3C84_693760 [compost metagenome]
MQQSTHRAQHHKWQSNKHKDATEQADQQNRALMHADCLAVFNRCIAFAMRRRIFQLTQLVDGVAHGFEQALAITKAQGAGALRIAYRQFEDPPRNLHPFPEAVVELTDQRLRLGTGLHRGIFLHAVISLLRILAMTGAQRFQMLVCMTIKQTAFGNESLIKITVGVEQQTDRWQVTFGQLRTGFSHLTDTAHTRPPHQPQQHSQECDRKGDFPAKAQIGKKPQHGVSLLSWELTDLSAAMP